MLSDYTKTSHQIVSDVNTPENVANKVMEELNNASKLVDSFDNQSPSDIEDISVSLSSRNEGYVHDNTNPSEEGRKQSNDAVASSDNGEENSELSSDVMQSQKELNKSNKSDTMEFPTSTICANEEDDKDSTTKIIIDSSPATATKAPILSLKEAAISPKQNSKSSYSEEVELKNLRLIIDEKDQSVTQRYVYHLNSKRSMFSSLRYTKLRYTFCIF